MADTTQKILSVELDAKSAIDGILKLNDAIDANNKQIALNKQAIKENNEAMKESDADTQELTAKNQVIVKDRAMLFEVISVHPSPFTNGARITFREDEIRVVVIPVQSVVQSIFIIMDMLGKNGIIAILDVIGSRIAVTHSALLSLFDHTAGIIEDLCAA